MRGKTVINYAETKLTERANAVRYDRRMDERTFSATDVFLFVLR
jgi:hypothetical protein